MASERFSTCLSALALFPSIDALAVAIAYLPTRPTNFFNSLFMVIKFTIYAANRME